MTNKHVNTIVLQGFLPKPQLLQSHQAYSSFPLLLSSFSFMHIRDLRRIRPMLDLKTASTIATSIVHVKLDYCNSLFLNIDITQINRLKAIQNTLAHAVTKAPPPNTTTSLPFSKTPLAQNTSTIIEQMMMRRYQLFRQSSKSGRIFTSSQT